MASPKADSVATTLFESSPRPSETSSIKLKYQDESPLSSLILHELEKIPDDVCVQLSSHGLNVTPQGLVQWRDGESEHPKNWRLSRKLYDSLLIILFQLVTTISSNTGSTSAEYSMGQLHISKEFAIFCFTTLYLFGQAIGSLILPPYTETFGRRPSYIAGCGLFSISCIIIAASNHVAGVIVGRFVSGFVSALPSSVACGSLEDMWDIRARIWALNLVTTAAVAGLGVGPGLATFVSTSTLGWQWTFWITAIMAGIVTILSLFMHESRASELLKIKLKLVAKAHKGRSMPKLHCPEEDKPPSAGTFVSVCLTRPAWLFFTEPIVLTVTLLCSVIYATLYLFAEAIQVVYHEEFGISQRHSSLVNLAFAIGPLFSVLTRLYDAHVSTRQSQRNISAVPEDKLFGFYIAAPLLTVASWYFAWTIPPDVTSVSPFVSMSALVLVGFATNEFDYVLSGYLTDTYTAWASSANAPLAFVRAILSGVFPLFGSQMFHGLGGNRAGSTLAVVATAYCVIAACFWKYGRRIREHSKVASL